ncbi:MAG: type II secretion system protein GspD [Verrucomicrobiae bacterium]|nr:type II secretion system protein GspD [Verrucomicrobiae bacterium]
MALPNLTITQIRELQAGIALHLEADLGYRSGSTSPHPLLPSPPEGLNRLLELARVEGQETFLIRLGIVPFISRAPQLWIQALRSPDPSSAWQVNPDLATALGLAEASLATTGQGGQPLTRDDLDFRLIQVSYIDVEGAIESLKGFGIETADSPAKVVLPVAFERLPIVARMPSPEGPKTALLGVDAQKGAAGFDLSMSPSLATALPPDPNLARSSQVLVYFHPDRPDQFTRVRRLLDEFIDRPARQIFIEGLILEISEEGLKELGVDWKYQEGGLELGAGNLLPGLPAASGTAGLTFDSLRDLDQQWVVRLRALVEEQKAEILSRPSVLTLNNRQATIRVGQEIPIATSSEAGIVKDANRISFNFKYLATGIALNIRPRITEDGNEVSMLVDTVVSAPIPGADLELRSSSGEVLASAPTVASRRVQTYTRIANNTPFIIGGLVNRQTTSIRRKVPLLGDIPYLGTFFRTRSTRTRKQEVIIVLTPHVLPEAESERAWGRYLPRDDAKFDDDGNVLFRSSYRIREEDVLDLSFLDRNERLNRYRDLARRVVERNFRLASRPPFNEFADGRVPGESILVERMIYEVVKRLSDSDPAWLDNRIAPDRIIFFSDQNAGGYDVQFLDRILAGFGDGLTAASFFTTQTNRALALTFRRGTDAITAGALTRNPIPEVSLIDCPDRTTWGELLWRWNQPEPDGTPRSTLLIHQPQDLVRLQRALLLREIINLNGGSSRVNRRNFSRGQVLLVPDENTLDTRLLDRRVAEHFLHTEHYYAAALRNIEATLAEIDRLLAESGSPNQP